MGDNWSPAPPIQYPMPEKMERKRKNDKEGMT